MYELATKVGTITSWTFEQEWAAGRAQLLFLVHSSMHLLPVGSACIMCGKALISTEHKAICEHPLWPLLDATIQNATLHPALHSLPTAPLEINSCRKMNKTQKCSSEKAGQFHAEGGPLLG